MADTQITQEFLHLKEISIPIFVYREHRTHVRASFASKGINLRIPRLFSSGQVRDQISWCKEWVRNKIKKKPALLFRYIQREYKDGYILSLFDRDITISLQPNGLKRTQTKLIGDQFIIHHPQSEPIPHTSAIRKKLISSLNKTYQPDLEERLRFINSHTLQAAYQSFKIKYLKTQWGNCASNGHIKLSTRLLLVPDKVQNAIILHELVHLRHFNHGDQFYLTLYGYMPDYEKRMSWLQKNEGILDL